LGNDLPVTFVEAVDQATDHPGDDLEPFFESYRLRIFGEATPPGDLQKRHAFLRRAACDGEEVAAIRLGEAAVSLS
jgi:hypothetical protein